jgi:hypothetical protein
MRKKYNDYQINQILETFNNILNLTEADIEGIDELVYNPLTGPGGAIGHGYDKGKKVEGITWKNHDDHLHLGFTDKEVAMKVIDKADAMGLKTTENPYAKKDPDGKVDNVHVKGSFHYKTFPGEPKVGMGVDISGSKSTIKELINWIEKTYATGSNSSNTSNSKDDKSSSKDSKIDVGGLDTSNSDTSNPFSDKSIYYDEGAAQNISKILGLSEGKTYNSFGNSISYERGNIIIPKSSNSKIKSPVSGVIDYNINSSGGDSVTIKHDIDGETHYLEFSNLENIKHSKGDNVSVNTIIGEPKDDVKVSLYNRRKNKIDLNNTTTSKKSEPTKKDDTDTDKDNDKSVFNIFNKSEKPKKVKEPKKIKEPKKVKEPKTNKTKKFLPSPRSTDKSKHHDEFSAFMAGLPLNLMSTAVSKLSKKVNEDIERIKKLL